MIQPVGLLINLHFKTIKSSGFQGEKSTKDQRWNDVILIYSQPLSVFIHRSGVFQLHSSLAPNNHMPSWRTPQPIWNQTYSRWAGPQSTRTQSKLPMIRWLLLTKSIICMRSYFTRRWPRLTWHQRHGKWANYHKSRTQRHLLLMRERRREILPSLWWYEDGAAQTLSLVDLGTEVEP